MAAGAKYKGLTLYTNGTSVKTTKLGGWQPLVRFINGEIVTDDFGGKLTVLNEKLEVLKTFRGSETIVRSLAGNDEYIAYGDNNGKVNYYSRTGGFEPKVSEVLTSQTQFF